MQNAMPLQLFFADPEIQNLCEHRAAAEKVLGAKVARQLRARLADLYAANSITEIVAGLPMPTGRGTFVIFLEPPHKIVLEPTMKPIPKTTEGKTDWGAIESFSITAVN
jgi:hypothetical protein